MKSNSFQFAFWIILFNFVYCLSLINTIYVIQKNQGNWKEFDAILVTYNMYNWQSINQGRVVQKVISANPGLKFNRLFILVCSVWQLKLKSNHVWPISRWQFALIETFSWMPLYLNFRNSHNLLGTETELGPRPELLNRIIYWGGGGGGRGIKNRILN